MNPSEAELGLLGRLTDQFFSGGESSGSMNETPGQNQAPFSPRAFNTLDLYGMSPKSRQLQYEFQIREEFKSEDCEDHPHVTCTKSDRLRLPCFTPDAWCGFRIRAIPTTLPVRPRVSRSICLLTRSLLYQDGEFSLADRSAPTHTRAFILLFGEQQKEG